MRPGARTAPPRWLPALAVAALLTGGTSPAVADDSAAPRTFEGPTYSAEYPTSPTGAANQNKLWFYADAWWALLADPTGRVLRVHELMPDHTWRPTSAVVSSDSGDSGDALLEGDTVHVLTRSGDGSLLYERLSFDAGARDYRVAAPVTVTTRKSGAPAVIAEDAAGALWVGYATATNVLVLQSTDGGQTWGRTVTLASRPDGQTPEIAALVAYDDRIGMLWSDQAAGAFQFASHRTGDDPSVWSREVAASGPGVAGNHISLAAVPGEPSDTLVAAVRTGRDVPEEPGDSTLLELLVRTPDGQWSAAPISTIADGLDDPVVQVDQATRTLRVFAARVGANRGGGTPTSAVVMKATPLDAIGFDPGPGEVFVNGTGRELGDPTVPKGPVDARSGLVVLAGDARTRIYRHAEMALRGAATVADPQDTVPPTTPSGLHAQATSSESVVLSWDAANDGDRWVPGGTGVPVAGYVVSRNGVEVATVTSTAYEDRSRATRARSVEYAVAAVDASGNRSTPTTLVVELPAPVKHSRLLPGAIALLALAGLLIAGNLVYRRKVARGARLPLAPQPPAERTDSRTPVA